MKASLEDLWSEALREVQPAVLIRPQALAADAAALFWGKAALSTWAAWSRVQADPAPPALVITAKGQAVPARGPAVFFGEHPLPGEGSFAAGHALLDFFDSLRRSPVSRLEVFLSGGASSLAWIPPVALSPDDLRRRLRDLYARPLSIAELNAARAKLCALKGGGAADLLARIAPRVRVRVHVLSDVWPFGPAVVGSGPFWDGRIRHEVWADNSRLVEAAARAARARGWPVLARHSLPAADWRDWVRRAATDARRALRNEKSGVILLSGEPRVALLSGGTGRGGRQTQIAAALALELHEGLAQGRVEIFCAASDGVDGASRSAGAHVTRAIPQRPLRESLRRFDSASVLARAGMLRPSVPTGTNVQDLVIVKTAASATSPRRTSSRA